MAKVGGKIGFTLKIPKASQYEFMRTDLSIDEIDTDGDIKGQLDLAEKAWRETWDRVTNLASEEILTHTMEVDAELQLQLKKKFTKIDAAIEELKAEIAAKATKTKKDK
jgi:hypothetical protein